MKKTSLFGFKWSKIHPPLPRTTRESQQLLGSLTSSFRRQLDHEYPTSAASDRGNERGGQPMRPESAAHMADKHFNDILENPLFRVVPKERLSWGVVNSERLAKEPMTVFDELVASGSVTHDRLCRCLESQFMLSTTAKGDRMEAMRASRAGSKVVSWWFASDISNRTRLFKSHKAHKYLCRFLAAEGMQDTVMAWLSMLMRPDAEVHGSQPPKSSGYPVSSYLLADFIVAEVEYGRGLASALTYYIQTHQLVSSTSDERNEELRKYQKRMLIYAGSTLNKWIIQHGQAKDIPVAMYEEYMTVISASAPWKIISHALPLYHPTCPDTGPFLRVVDGIPLEAFGSWFESRRENLRESFIRAGFDALRLLIDRQQFGDATRLARYIQQLLPGKNVSEATSSAYYHVSPEEEFLLDRLQFALA